MARMSERDPMTTRAGRAGIVAAAIVAGAVIIAAAILFRLDDRLAALPGTKDPVRGNEITLPPEQFGSMIAPGGQRLDDVHTLIGRLAARLEQAPGDVRGWSMLGWSYAGVGEYDNAARAYSRAAALDPGNAGLLALLAEAMVNSSAGKVTSDARAVLEKALAIDPSDPRASYFRGVALDQDGNPKAAVDLWLGLLDRSPPDAPWRPDLIARIRDRADAAGLDLASRPDLAPAAPPTGPTQADIDAAAGMTAADRQTMIRGMVGGLADRLKATPDDIDGWEKLIRAYVVLEDGDAAATALATARETFAARPDDLSRLQNLAAGLGLN